MHKGSINQTRKNQSFSPSLTLIPQYLSNYKKTQSCFFFLFKKSNASSSRKASFNYKIIFKNLLLLA